MNNKLLKVLLSFNGFCFSVIARDMDDANRLAEMYGAVIVAVRCADWR